MAERRKKLVGMVEPETHRAWHSFAHDRGVDLTALLEAIGRRLAALDDRVPDYRLPTILRDAVKEARDVKWQRSRRS